jgi:hypothetical protein
MDSQRLLCFSWNCVLTPGPDPDSGTSIFEVLDADEKNVSNNIYNYLESKKSFIDMIYWMMIMN